VTSSGSPQRAQDGGKIQMTRPASGPGSGRGKWRHPQLEHSRQGAGDGFRPLI